MNAARLEPNAPQGGTWVKVCGCTSAQDVTAAVAAGADAVGFVFADSPRRVSPEEAARAARSAPPETALVGVFVDPSERELEEAARAIPRLTPQFSGSEAPNLCRHLRRPYLKVLFVTGGGTGGGLRLEPELAGHEDALLVFETASSRRGGSGRTFEWGLVEELVRERPSVISGGLHPGNVGACVSRLRPYGVDVRSGVERGGRKDPALVAAFVRAVRSAGATP